MMLYQSRPLYINVKFLAHWGKNSHNTQGENKCMGNQFWLHIFHTEFIEIRNFHISKFKTYMLFSKFEMFTQYTIKDGPKKIPQQQFSNVQKQFLEEGW